MADAVSFTAQDGVAEALIDNPPVNATSAAVRAGLQEAIRRFEQDPSLKALVIRCAGKTFVAGADIKEFGKPMAPPALPDLLQSLDDVSKPVIAALHGTVLGGGLELALACHYRIAAPGAVFGFPEVKLGIIPGAGGTQRAPRLAGLKAAIQLVTEGGQIDAPAARAAHLVDEIAEGELGAAARAFAQKLVAEGKGPRSTRDLPMPADDPAVFDEARKTLARKLRGQTAPLLGLDAIRLGYELPWDAALKRENEMCREAVAGPQSKALRHIFAAEREVAKIPGLPADTPVREVRQAGVIGLGSMGRGIVMAIAASGVPVTAVARSEASLGAARAAVEKLWGGMVAKGQLGQAALDERLGRIRWSTELADLAEADLVVEAVSEDMPAKVAVFEALGRITRPGAVLASNTSYLDIDALAQASGRPADVCGMHFFTPAHVMRLLENVRGKATSPEVIATIMAFGKKIGKLPILSGVCDGFIVNRMLSKRSRESYFLVEEGASPAAIDKVVTGFGFPMGPYALSDLAGIDVQYAARQARRARLSSGELRADFVDQLYAKGRYGQKTGAGWYRYDENRKASDDPEIDALIAAHAEKHGLRRREIGEDEIRERLLYAMVNEGAKILDEGIAARPQEIDVAMVNGVGFPAYTGGPMFWADQVGLPKILAAIERFGAEHGDEYWTPAPLLARLAGEGQGFYA